MKRGLPLGGWAMRGAGILAMSVLAAAGLQPLGARLISETLDGSDRVCRYSAPPTGPLRSDSARAALANRYIEYRVALGERCPTNYPRPTASIQTRPPSLAILTSQRVQDRERICVYTWGGRDYPYRVGLARACPLTPHF